MPDDPVDPSLKSTDNFDDVAIKRARELLNAMPENVGPYRILERIGGGGMGDVYRAEQRSPIRRQVALKFIKLGMDSKAVIARFEAERQALALMDHPHIAKVFDAGTDETGRPFFVMEYVKGKPITDYSDQNHLTIAERLRLFEQVCQAVQHAHHKGVIHRDLKPANVLVSTQDDEPFSKVIDFGVAKAISHKLTDETLFTQHDQFVGTPQYMSPEQAEGSVDIDTRTDVYSLGVLLYELLTGSPPFSTSDIKAAAFEQLKKLIIEVDPPKPSTRLTPNTPMLNTLAAFRRIEPRRLGTLVQGELDWIVMKAIEKDRRRRYETPTSLANDILAHLNGEPVQAAPPSAAYRIQKFVRKNRGLVGGILSVMVALLVGIFGTAWGMIRARIAEKAATESEFKKDEQRKLAEAAAKAESEQRTRAEVYLANGILRPIGFNETAFDPAELRSFIEWSALEDSRLQLLVMEVAFENPETALRIARRAQRVIQSCVGLSLQRRTKAIEFVSIKQRDRSADPRVRVAACCLALKLGSTDLPAFDESARYLSDGIPRFDFLYEFVGDAVSYSDLSHQTVSNRMLWDALITILRKSPKWGVYHEWTPRVSPVRDGLVALAPRLERTRLTRSVDTLFAILENSSHSHEYRPATAVLVALVPRMEPTQVTRTCDALFAVLEQSTVADPRSVAARGGLAAARDGLVIFMPRLEPAQVAKSGDALIAILENSADNDHVDAACAVIAALAPQLTADQVTKAWSALVAILENSADNDHVDAACPVIAALAPRLTADQVTKAWSALVAVLQNKDLKVRAGDGLVALVPQLEPTQVADAWDALIAVLEKSAQRNSYAEGSARQALVALVSRLEPIQVRSGWDALVAVLEPAHHPLQLIGSHWVEELPLVALAMRLERSHVTTSGDALVALLEGSTDGGRRRSAGEVLVSLAPRLEPPQLARCCDALIAILEKSPDSAKLMLAVVGIYALAPRLEPTQVKRAWDALITVTEKSGEEDVRKAAFVPLLALVRRLEPNQVTMNGDAMIAALIAAVQKSTWSGYAEKHVLSALVLRSEPPQVKRCWDALIANHEKLEDWRALHENEDVFTLLANGLDISGREICVSNAMATICDVRARMTDWGLSDPDKFPAGKEEVGNLFMELSQPVSLAKLLSHPGCIGELRREMLLRFEELVIYDGRPVFSPPDKEEDQKTRAPIPQRRFHNIYDAAAWIQQNWPDFDLETNHPVTWRAEAGKGNE